MNSSKLKKLSQDDFKDFGPISKFVSKKIETFNLGYRHPSQKERDEIILKILLFLNTDEVTFSGSHRKTQWEDGWGENLKEYLSTGDLESLVPKYFGKYNVQRLNGDFIIPDDSSFEIKLVSLIQYIIFEKYFKNSDTVYEFGAGTGHNLLRMREVNPSAMLHSMEWARSGVDLLNEVAKTNEDSRLCSTVFDNFNPDYDIKLENNSSVYTFAALEQLGDDSDSIINYWIENNPSIIVNVEPMSEPLDSNELLQYLSIQYFNKRKYLEGYINKLGELEKQGKVVIHDVIRTGLGSLYIEGYSVIAWSPVK